MSAQSKNLEAATRHVDHLLEQYQDYLAVTREIDELKSKLMERAIELGASDHKPFAQVLAEKPAALASLHEEIEAAEARQQQISDEMTFANPVVWMMYKFKAYAGTSTAIGDMEDFRKHCSPEGYICTTRFRFLRKYLQDAGMPDLLDTKKYPDSLSLDQLYQSDDIVSLPSDSVFMSQWNEHEFYKQNGRVAKWEDVRPAFANE